MYSLTDLLKDIENETNVKVNAKEFHNIPAEKEVEEQDGDTSKEVSTVKKANKK